MADVQFQGLALETDTTVRLEGFALETDTTVRIEGLVLEMLNGEQPGPRPFVSSIPSLEFPGIHTLTPGPVVHPAGLGITSEEAFGTTVATGAGFLDSANPAGIPTEETLGTVTVHQVALPTGVLGGEVFGVANGHGSGNPVGIVSEEAFGVPVLSTTPTTVLACEILSAEAFGTPTIRAITPPYSFGTTFLRGRSFKCGRESLIMKDELAELLWDHGREVFLRQKTGQRCVCWDPRVREADPNCPSCSSTGWLYVDKRIRTYKRIPTEPTAGAYRKNPINIGILAVDESVFYLENITQVVHPSVHDWVVECVTSVCGELVRPYKIERAWSVNEVIDYRERCSTLSYYALRCRRIEVSK